MARAMRATELPADAHNGCSRLIRFLPFRLHTIPLWRALGAHIPAAFRALFGSHYSSLHVATPFTTPGGATGGTTGARGATFPPSDDVRYYEREAHHQLLGRDVPDLRE